MRTRATLAATTGLLPGGGRGTLPTTTGTAGTPAVATPTEAPVVPPTAPGYPYADPADVCGLFVSALLSADTALDAGPVDAVRRARAVADAALPTGLVTTSRDGR